MESNAAGNDFRQHGFTSNSNGTPDWSFRYPVSDPNLPASSRKVAASRDGSTIAAVVSDSVTQDSTLYVFDAATGAVRLMWTDPLRMDAVDLTDNGSIALVTQDNLAALVDTSSGNILFSVAGSGAGNIFYRISGDGSVFVVDGLIFDVYKYDGTTYQRVIHFSRPTSWFGGASIVSRDGSTAGSFAGNYANNWLTGEVFLFDVATAQLIGSYPVSGSGSFQGTPIGAESNDNGTVLAFASWGTEFHDWPEVMVFNRNVELIGAIDFPGSAFSVGVSADGQYVVGGSKAVHANQFGSGGRIELIQLQATPTPTPTPTTYSYTYTYPHSYPKIYSVTTASSNSAASPRIRSLITVRTQLRRYRESQIRVPQKPLTNRKFPIRVPETPLISIRAHNEMLSVIAIPRLRPRSFDLMISSFNSSFRRRVLATGASVTAVGSITVVVAAVSVRPHNPGDSNRRDRNPVVTIRSEIIACYKNRILTRSLT